MLSFLSFFPKWDILIFVHMNMRCVGFSSYMSSMIPTPCFCCRFRLFTVCSVLLMADEDEVAFRCNVTTVRKTAVISNDIRPIILWTYPDVA